MHSEIAFACALLGVAKRLLIELYFSHITASFLFDFLAYQTQSSAMTTKSSKGIFTNAAQT